MERDGVAAGSRQDWVNLLVIFLSDNVEAGNLGFQPNPGWALAVARQV